MDQVIGRVLHDRYRIKSLIGCQTGRRTFLASDLRTGLSVIVKLLLFGPDFTWDDLKLFEREAEVLKSLDHPAIPKYLDYFEVETELGKGFALVQTYIEAQSLQDWIQSGRTFKEEDLKVIAKELLKILDYLHHRQPSVIHRDIKPSNILLGDSPLERLRQRSGNSLGRIYLIDFGSVQTAVHGGTRTIVGTYGYMPLEQFGGQTMPASDLYALGATLIYLATGHHPDSLPQQELKIVFEDRVNLSSNLIAWLRWTTEPRLELRLQSARQGLEALERLASQNLSSAIRFQPARSRIKVRNSVQGVEILIPLRKLNIDFISFLMWSFVWASFLISIAAVIVSLALGKGWGFFTLVIYGALAAPFALGSFCIVRDTLRNLSRQRLRITPQTVTLMYELFGVRFLRFPLAITFDQQTVTNVEYIRPRFKSDSSSRVIEIFPHINILALHNKLTIGTEKQEGYRNSGRITNRDLHWLKDVLDNSLNKKLIDTEEEESRDWKPLTPQDLHWSNVVNKPNPFVIYPLKDREK